MAINFPSNPNNGDTLDVGQTTYAFNSTTGVWDIESPASSGASTTVYADMAALIAATGMSNGDQAFVTANNNLYIYSGSGWYKVATVQNDSPSAITGVASSYALAIDGTATTITAVSTDPDGFPLTWSYATSGLGSIATISQADNVFTITPSTDSANAGTFTLTLNATDGVNGAVSTNTDLTLDFIVILENSKYTTLLATATGTSDNNNITDASTNNHSITVSGDAHAGTFSPYRSGGYSVNFDGDGDYIKMSNSPGVSLDGEFVIELWTRFTIDDQGVSGANIRIFTTNDSGNSGDNLQLVIRKNQGTIGSVAVYTNNWKVSGTTAINDGKWHHVAITRDSSDNFKLFIDGTENDSNTISTTFTLTNGRLGTRDTGSNSSNYTGEISDFRIRRGVSTFSVPTSRLVSDSNTHILACHLPYFKDGSSNNNTLDLTGDGQIGHATIKHYGPYDYEEYDAADHGGSVYFDGSGDKLTISDSLSDFNFGTNSFTIEGWVYSEVAAIGPIFTTHRVGTTSGYYLALLANNGIGWGNYVDGTGDIATAANAIEQKSWNHISLNRDASSSNSLKIYVNGVLKYTGTSSTNYNNFDYGPFVGGYDPSGTQYDFTGYISDLVVVNGSVLRTGGSSIGDVAFTPPATPIATPSNTKLHLKGTDASIIDKSQGSNLKLVGNTTGSSTTNFTGAKSMYFDGTGDGIVVPHNDNLNLNSSDWTIEFWYNVTNPNAIRNWNFISKGDNSTVRPYAINFRIDNSNGVEPRIFPSADLSSQGQISNNAWQTFGNWHHVAFVRVHSTGVITRYLNGQANGTTTSDVATNTENLEIGYVASGSDEEGYIQDLRITKGLARYTANFTPPTESLKG